MLLVGFHCWINRKPRNWICMHVNLDVQYGFSIGFLFLFTYMDLSLCLLILWLLNFMLPCCNSDITYVICDYLLSGRSVFFLVLGNLCKQRSRCLVLWVLLCLIHGCIVNSPKWSFVPSKPKYAFLCSQICAF